MEAIALKRNKLYIIAGCNGAGKTTASFTILPEILNCKEFVNADEIAKGLSPFQPDTVAIEAGRLMLRRIDELIELKVDLAFETTLATKSYVHKILYAKQQGYQIILLFYWLHSVELAIERVRQRVREGGHNIASDVIIRRYHRGLINLFDLYLPITERAMLFDNSDKATELIAEKRLGASHLTIYNQPIYNLLKDNSHGNTRY